jgi:para-nitrobenzyl esterase
MRTGDPNTPALPQWSKYTEGNCETMILDDKCEVKNNPDKNGREALG